MAVTADRPAPYATTGTIMEVISRHRARGLQAPINGEVLGRVGVSESLVPRTLQALVTLDLIDDQGAPTAIFESLRLAPESEYPTRLANWLNAAYADVLTYIDPATATETQIRDAFRPYRPNGQQDRMMSLFTGLYAAAGVRPEREKAQQSRQPSTRPAATSGTSRPSRAGVPRGWEQTVKARKAPPPLDHNTTAFPPAIQGLLVSLPKSGTGWTKAQRDAFYAAFGTILDFCFPIMTPEELSADMAPGDE